MNKPYSQDELKIRDNIVEMKTIFSQNGVDSSGIKLSLEDTLAVPNMPQAFKRVIEEVVIEAIEPTLIGTNLLSQITVDENQTDVRFRTYGAMDVGDISMGEGQEYPEFSMNQGGGQVHANIGKYGLRLRLTDEMIRASQWDIIGMHLRKLGQAMGRAKEQNIFKMITSQGVVAFDNANPTQSEFGRTKGRDITGAGNGSFTADDMYDMYASMLQRGFTPNVILCHPLAWATFTKDPVLREYALKNGDLSKWFTSMPNGPALQGQWLPEVWKNFTRMSGQTAFGATPEERVGTQSSTFQFPSYFPGTNLQIIASPHVPFDPVKKTTSILMLDTRELGAIFVAEQPTIEEWRDPARDLQNLKIRERYGLALFNEGEGISIAQNISIEPNEIVLPPQAIVNNLPRIVGKP